LVVLVFQVVANGGRFVRVIQYALQATGFVRAPFAQSLAPFLECVAVVKERESPRTAVGQSFVPIAMKLEIKGEIKRFIE